MHEAGLARGVAKALRERGLRVDQVRLAVCGGTREVEEFEGELRTYLIEAMPDQAAGVMNLDIRRVPFGHLCPSCGAEFTSPGAGESCPNCGSETVPEIPTERIEIELLEPVP
jgi:Zn finger protein HypA/HybF involved in hydrogenase expression